jgi:L,D-peptidoglycan transpeptidase YkuD (ErfK/YbiS/YcfS/YnhG family)
MAQKLEAKGGKGGNQWDDLLDHDNIAKIHVQGGHEGIQYVKFDYVKFDNLKIGQPKLGSIHGLSRKGFTQTFEIDPTSEYIVSVEGYYDESKGIIQALKFKTNKKTSDMIGYDENGLKFSLEVKGKAIIGFHGFADTNLNSLGAYFAPAPPTKFDYQGGSGAQLWDDGSNYNGVRKVSFSLDDTEIRQIRIEYDKSGLVEKREYGSNVGRQEEFVLDYPTEYIIYMEGTCDIVSDTSKNRVRSLMFKTSKGRTSPIFGKVAARKFVFESNGSALIGFHGRAAAAVDAIGAYFSPLILSAPAPPPPPAEKLQAKGGNGGNQWDDLADHDHVTKIYVQGGQEGIQYVKFDYVKNGQPQSGSVHGLLGRGFTQTFEIDPTNEHLVSVEGYYDESKGLVQGLKFKTNKKTSDMIGYDENGLKFSLEVNGKKIIGFHGYAQTYLNSLGAYFVTAPPTKFDYQGGSGAQLWDDGTNYNGVRKISFALDANEIRQIRIDYDKGGLIERREYGGNVGRQEEVQVLTYLNTLLSLPYIF